MLNDLTKIENHFWISLFWTVWLILIKIASDTGSFLQQAWALHEHSATGFLPVLTALECIFNLGFLSVRLRRLSGCMMNVNLILFWVHARNQRKLIRWNFDPLFDHKVEKRKRLRLWIILRSLLVAFHLTNACRFVLICSFFALVFRLMYELSFEVINDASKIMSKYFHSIKRKV